MLYRLRSRCLGPLCCCPSNSARRILPWSHWCTCLGDIDRGIRLVLAAHTRRCSSVQPLHGLRKDCFVFVLRTTQSQCRLSDCDQNYSVRHRWRIYIGFLWSPLCMSPGSCQLGPFAGGYSNLCQPWSDLYHHGRDRDNNGRLTLGDTYPVDLAAADADKTESWFDHDVRHWIYVR